MARLLPTSVSCATALVVAFAAVTLGCSREDRVELRLQPCDIDGYPRSVRVRIEPFGADGAISGEIKTEAFAIPEAAVFDDGYASLGYVPPEGATSATVTIAWFAEPTAGQLLESDHIVVWSKIKLPQLGASIELGAEGCAPWIGTGTGTGTGTEGTSTGTTGEGTSSGSATVGMTTSGTSTTSTTSTSDTEGTSTTGTSGTGDTEGTSGTSGTTEGTGSTTGGETMAGQPCIEGDPNTCETLVPGEVGTVFVCKGGVWVDGSVEVCTKTCVMPFYELANGKGVGCSGNGSVWGCLCVDEDQVMACEIEDQVCKGTMGGLIKLCIDNELIIGDCPNGCEDENGPICK